MTRRRLVAILLGVLGATFIAGAGLFNRQVLRLPSLTDGQLLPISVFGVLALLALTAIPLLWAVFPRLRFRPSELAVIVGLMLVGCSISGRGLMDTFIHALALPAYHNANEIGWRSQGLLDHVPPQMLPAGGSYDDRTTLGIIHPMGREGQPIGPSDVPWADWRAPLQTWMPMVVLLAICVICLSLIVHRQWSRNEHLRYPIAEFASSLMDQDGRAYGPVLRDRMFLLGLIAIVAIRGVNMLYAWFPEHMVDIPVRHDFRGLMEFFPSLAREPFSWDMLRVKICPIAIAFCFFLASDVTLSLGLTQYIAVPVSAMLIGYGVDMRADQLSGGTFAWQRFGSFLAVGMILLYTGRHYYRGVLQAAIGMRPRADVEPHASWACRAMILAAVGLTVLFIRVGLDWPFAVLMVMLMLLMFVVTARIAAETGLFWIQPGWQPVAIIFGLFGAYAMGPEALIIVGMLCVVLCIDPSESLMPYFVNALRIGDITADKRAPFRPGRFAIAGSGVFIIGLAVAVPIALWACYNYTPWLDGYRLGRVPTMTFRMASEAVSELDLRVAESEALSVGERLMNAEPNPDFLLWAGVGLALALGVGALRLRLPWWPIHPIIFLVWQTWPLVRLHHSFLIGWMLKQAVTRYGGMDAYHRVRRLMIGVIAGDLLMALTHLVVGGIYFFATGNEPPLFLIFPA